METASFELHFRPNVELVSTVRRFVSDFYARITPDAETLSRLVMTTHELLENAVRYAENNETVLMVCISRTAPSEGRIATRNMTSAEHRAALVRRVQEIEEAEDPDAYYQAVLRQSLVDGGPGGLGLPRIRAEADMQLTLEEEADGALVVSATTKGWS